MNFQKKKKLIVPENLEKFLIELTVEILIHNPSDLNDFGYKYFKNIKEKESECLDKSEESLIDENEDKERSPNEDECKIFPTLSPLLLKEYKACNQEYFI